MRRARGVVLLLCVLVSAGCYGHRTAMITTLTDEGGVPLQHVGLRVFPAMRILPSFPVTWGATNADGEALLNIEEGTWRLSFDWNGRTYATSIWTSQGRPQQDEAYEVRPESEAERGPLVRVRSVVAKK